MRLDPQVKERLKKAFSAELASQREAVRIVSSYALSQKEIDSILLSFPQFSKGKIENVVDKTLLGGFVIQSGSQMIDLSIRNALHSLQKKLYESV